MSLSLLIPQEALKKVLKRLAKLGKTAGYMMTPEQCENFIMAEQSDPENCALVADFPVTHAYLNTFW